MTFSDALLPTHYMPVGLNLPTLAQLMTGHCPNSDLAAVPQTDKDKTEVEARDEHKGSYLWDP